MQQIIIFLTKNKIFGRKILSSERVKHISIKGAPSSQCEKTADVDKFISCLLDNFGIRTFEDEPFDITILDCNANKELLKTIFEKCADSKKLNVIGIDNILPAIVLNKKKLQPGEKVKVEFAGDNYVLSCNENSIINVLPDNDGIELDDETLQINDTDFNFLYAFSGKTMNIGIDEQIIKEKNAVIENLQRELESVKKLVEKLRLTKVYPGAVVLGNVEKIDNQGVHVSFVFNHYVGATPIPYRYEGLIPCSEWEENAKPEDLMNSVNVGDEVTSVVVPDLDAEEFAFMIDERVSSTDIEESGIPLFASDETITLSRKRFSAEKTYKRSDEIS